MLDPLALLPIPDRQRKPAISKADTPTSASTPRNPAACWDGAGLNPPNPVICSAPTETGRGSGVLNSCSFLGGTVGVTGGGIAFGLAV